MKTAFTLAETLVTIGVIGIVAALTLPALIQNYQKFILKNQFKKTYNVLQNAYRKLEAEFEYTPDCYYGNISNFTECSKVRKKIKTILNVVKECNGNALKDGCIPNYKGSEDVHLSNNPDATDEEIDYELRGCNGFRKNSIDNINISWNLADGTILFWHANTYPLFAVDINGFKKPNKWGYDVFPLEIYVEKNHGYKIIGASCIGVEKGGIPTVTMIKTLYE